jgi:hypothetical protein
MSAAMIRKSPDNSLQQGIEEGCRQAEEEMPGVELKFDPTRGHDVKK